ncbi:MAG: hypothetical protein QOJ29_4967 [Thermoleophilaceae bacterium]|jgi:hypothetical protein|nr:hypothetical protein [Thermoleophilaceae bacterium]
MRGVNESLNERHPLKKFLNYGGIVASAILIAFGIGAIVIGANGRSTVRDSLSLEKIVGSPDMNPKAIAAEAKAAGLTGVALPTKSVADQPITNGSLARTFADYIRIHTLEASGGKTYAELPRFATKDGKGTSDEKLALAQPNGRPVDNPTRNLWITSTSLRTALNTAYFAENVALFSIVMGIALLLTGIGFLVLTLSLLMRPARQAAAAASTKVAPRPAVAVG